MKFYALKTEVYLGNTLSLCVLPVKPLKEISPGFFSYQSWQQGRKKKITNVGGDTVFQDLRT